MSGGVRVVAIVSEQVGQVLAAVCSFEGSIEVYVRRVRFARGGGDLQVDRLRQLVARVLTRPREVTACISPSSKTFQ